MGRLPLLLLFLLPVLLLPLTSAEIKTLKITLDSRPMILFERFGFTHTGQATIAVSSVSVVSSVGATDPSRLGFFLLSEESLIQVLLELQTNPSFCVLDSKYINLLFTFRDLSPPPASSFNHSYPITAPNEYSLFFANCAPQSTVSMDVQTELYNFDGREKDFLSAGLTQLPTLFFCFFVIYFAFFAFWIYICVKSIRVVLLFTVIVLIGTGWSFLKPVLQEREKKVLMIVIPLQVLANIASIVIGETGPFIKDWVTWNQVFLLVDIICCCAVIFPIVWSIRSLRETSKTDGKAARNLAKLTLFRQFYIVVIGYLYFTRIVVFALRTIAAYKYQWVSNAAEEIANLAFYVVMFYMFRPVDKNGYFVIDEDEEAAELALRDEEFEL
ncbi:UNVERIFIED_CONTAM: protein CANDIDATE G-PROTEIN COUPLED RECEPTOR 7 [Sesamum latifolium]|uniref:Protein CANDIDATE G-PROTEIN COUPLED RECEPTOR 7 n=1 Tax=Sesamum latifolium TaxID=2727402 RepID=A0AAW2VAB2_9LAMI